MEKTLAKMQRVVDLEKLAQKVRNVDKNYSNSCNCFCLYNIFRDCHGRDRMVI